MRLLFKSIFTIRFLGHVNACAASRIVSTPPISEVCPGGVTRVIILFERSGQLDPIAG